MEGGSQWGALGPLLQEGFSVIPNIVLRDRSLTGNAKLTWALIYDYTHRKTAPEMTALQADLGVGERVARAALRELETAGLVVRKRQGRGLPNEYRLTVPAWMIEGETLHSAGSRTASAQGLTPLKDVEEDREVEAEASTSPGKQISTRKRNLVFDALVTATHANPKADGGQIAKAAKAIREAMDETLRELTHVYMERSPEADEVPADVLNARVAEEILMRAAMYARMRPEWELTPTALAKHWNRIPTWQPKAGDRLRPEDIARRG